MEFDLATLICTSCREKFEHWRTVEDSSGRKEEVYTKVADGQKHTITRKVDSVGNEEETEEVQTLGNPYEDQFDRTSRSPLSDNHDQANDQLYSPYQQGISSIRYYFSNLFGFKRD
uniref:Uncharacterized protein n=1 Tax=Octopus bimaculoides TaxID=37653 RepID=A0A0L8FM58_OCTBM